MINMDHIVSDGWSIGVMLSDLAHLYEAYTQGMEYHRCQNWMCSMQTTLYGRDSGCRERSYRLSLSIGRESWKGGSAGAANGQAEASSGQHRGASQSIELSQELTEKLRQVSKREGVTLFMTLLAGLRALLARYSGQRDFAVGLRSR